MNEVKDPFLTKFLGDDDWFVIGTNNQPSALMRREGYCSRSVCTSVCVCRRLFWPGVLIWRYGAACSSMKRFGAPTTLNAAPADDAGACGHGERAVAARTRDTAQPSQNDCKSRDAFLALGFSVTTVDFYRC